MHENTHDNVRREKDKGSHKRGIILIVQRGGICLHMHVLWQWKQNFLNFVLTNMPLVLRGCPLGVQLLMHCDEHTSTHNHKPQPPCDAVMVVKLVAKATGGGARRESNRTATKRR
ncbi:hypothetical protein L1887_01522 [Cichorium endivia]|nr:hypothetical protein L1887_01522 [Cichorium endivia]